MKRFENKIVLVTGAGRGIGASIAKRFASEGAEVIVNYSGNDEAAQKTVDEITATGGTRNSLFEHERRSLDIAVGNDRRRNVVANGCSFFGNIPILFGSRSNSGRFRRGIDLHFLVA